jgi:hypothetical protein
VEKGFVKEEVIKVVENKDVSEENLIKHKILIKELIGAVNREEDAKYLMSLEKRNFENDVKVIIH